MKIFIAFILTFMFLFSGCTNNDFEKDVLPVDDYTRDEIIIVAVGDSLTEGLGVDREDSYPSILEKELIKRKYDNVKVFNSGVSGETSTALYSRMGWVLKLNPDVVILGIGANDAIRGIDLQITKKNIENIIIELTQRNITVVLLGQDIFDNLGKDYVLEFKSIYPDLANKYQQIYFVEDFLQGVSGNASLNNNDRIHPNALGYKYIVENNVLPIILEVLDSK